MDGQQPSGIPLRSPNFVLFSDLFQENVYALKRLFASDRADAAVAKFEVDLANNLPPHPNIVKFLGASISATGGKVEALILMEMCQSEGLLGVLNTLFSQRRSMQEEHLLDILIAIGNYLASRYQSGEYSARFTGNVEIV